MCGGEGSKIWPYNRFWQKACLPVGNTSNVLRIVNQLKNVEFMVGGMEELKKILRSSMVEGIITFEELEKQGTDLSPL